MKTQLFASLKPWLKTVFFKEERLRPVWLLVFYPPVLVLTGIIIIFPITSLLNALGYPPAPFWGTYTLATCLRKTISVGETVMTLWIGTWLWRRFLGKSTLASLGLSFRSPWLKELGIGFLAGMGFTGAIFIVEYLMGWIEVDGFSQNLRPGPEVFAFLYFMVVGVVENAVAEEVIMRGYLLQTLEKWIGLPAGVIISSSVFGVAHLLNPTSQGWAIYVIPFALTLYGIMLATAYLARRSLWIPIGLHFAWNLFEYRIFALTGALPADISVLVTRITGPAFWVGLPNSDFGPEVGMLGILTGVCGIGLFWLLGKHKSPKKRSAQAP